MRRMILVTAAGLLLVGAGVAVAHGFDSRGVKAVNATFTATGASDVRTTTCTGEDGTYEKSRGTYAGTADSTEASLKGNATISATSVINTTTKVGIVSGDLRIETADGGRTRAHFDGVFTDGKLVGLATGGTRHGHDNAGVKLLANLSADYGAATGFANGKVGTDVAGGAVLITPGGCRPAAPSKPDHITASGKITAVSDTSITVAGVTCSVPDTLKSSVSTLKTDETTTIECDVVNGANTLTRVGGDHYKGSRHGNEKKSSHRGHRK
jgi:hypothetical protein